MKQVFKKPIFWILIVSILPVFSWFHVGMPFVHDGQDHVTRIASFYASLTEGILVPRWAGNLNWGYGHPILMFLYPLPSYTASMFHVLGFSFVDSTKLVFIVGYVLSVIGMYIWMNASFGMKAAVIGSLLYGFAPYRFVDLHVRGAIGEHVAFIFPPLILFALLKLRKTFDLKYILGLASCMGALILSHNAVALMFLPLIGMYGLYLIWAEERKGRWIFVARAIVGIILGFGLAAFFWIPALFEGKFTLRDIVTAGEALQRFVPPYMFLYSPWNYGGGNDLTKFLGLVQWIGLFSGIGIISTTKDKKLRVVLSGLFALLVVSLIMMTSWSATIWREVKILQNFQFPWRFLTLSVFLVAAIGGISLDTLLARIKNVKVHHNIFLALCIAIVILTMHMWYPKGYHVRHESFYTGTYPGTTDTGESSPIWSTRFMERTPANPLSVIDGEAVVTAGKRTSTIHEYVLDVKKPTLMLENTVYFPGWTIYLDGLPTGIQFQNPDYRGLMLFRVTEETQNVRVVFEDTKIRRVSNLISLATIVVLSSIGIGGSLWRKKRA
jgi:hypothetical protein